MIEFLEHLSDVDKAGVLARAAFSLDDTPDAKSIPLLDQELSARNEILRSLRFSLGIDLEDNSSLAISKLEDAIDGQLSELIGPRDEESVLRRMVKEGTLPSDLYTINFIYESDKGKFLLHKRDYLRAKQTIKNADREQHLLDVGDGSGNRREMISIFAKTFHNEKNPANSFVGIVVAERGENLVMSVLLFLRIYESKIYSGPGDLVEVLRRFAYEYGMDFLYNGEKYRFVWKLDSLAQNSHEFHGLPLRQKNAKGRWIERHADNYSLALFSGNQEKSSALIFRINLEKYEKSLKLHNWEQDLP